MKKNALITALLLILPGVALMTVATYASVVPDGQAMMVKIDNFTFNPATVTVKAGTAVHWTNSDDIPHTVASTDKAFKSKVLDTNDDFEFKFDKPGTYEYFCSLHPKMTGKVIVQ